MIFSNRVLLITPNLQSQPDYVKRNRRRTESGKCELLQGRLRYKFSTMVISEEFAEVWERTLQSGQADLPPEAARYFLKMHFAEVDHQRMNALAAKAREGYLTENEESDLAN